MGISSLILIHIRRREQRCALLHRTPRRHLRVRRCRRCSQRLPLSCCPRRERRRQCRRCLRHSLSNRFFMWCTKHVRAPSAIVSFKIRIFSLVRTSFVTRACCKVWMRVIPVVHCATAWSPPLGNARHYRSYHFSFRLPHSGYSVNNTHTTRYCNTKDEPTREKTMPKERSIPLKGRIGTIQHRIRKR